MIHSQAFMKIKIYMILILALKNIKIINKEIIRLNYPMMEVPLQYQWDNWLNKDHDRSMLVLLAFI